MTKLYKKIDLFLLGEYLCSTNQSKTCKEAKQRYIERLQEKSHKLGGLTFTEDYTLKNPQALKAYFDRER